MAIIFQKFKVKRFVLGIGSISKRNHYSAQRECFYPYIFYKYIEKWTFKVSISSVECCFLFTRYGRKVDFSRFFR